MSKIIHKPDVLFYPAPVVMVSCGDFDLEKNIITLSWTGNINSDKPMTYISIRPGRHSYNIIKETGEYTINLVNELLVKEADFCGIKSGKDIDKFKELALTPERGNIIKCPSIKESPVSIECKVKDIINLGTHDMFLGEVVSASIDEDFVDKNGKFDFEMAKLTCYSDKKYFGIGKFLGNRGFSISK